MLSKNTLTIEELHTRAEHFALKFANATDERAEAQTYWNEFFQIFGIDRYRIARFEKPTLRNQDGHKRGFIDLFWRGKLLIEHKSANKNKEKDFADALAQAQDYADNLSEEKDKPKYIIICNFQEIRVLDTRTKQQKKYVLADLPTHIYDFTFFQRLAEELENEEEAANIEAAERIGKLYSAVKATGYAGEDLQLLMIRILFCLFAEDTGIFKRCQFQKLVEDEYKKENPALGALLESLFLTLNTNDAQRDKSLAESVAAFPYVNGSLFQKPLSQKPNFSQAVHLELFNCCRFDWAQISPAIFGSLFQSVMNDKERHDLGAHYTSETNILRLIRPLFLDELWADFEKNKYDVKKLRLLQQRIENLRFLDPACGCGNFLIITYREMRLLDMEIFKALRALKSEGLSGSLALSSVHLDHFCGIEYEGFAAYVARVALWLCKHQMNRRLEEEFGVSQPTIPLTESANILNDNALRLDWKNVFGENIDFIIGNPPFLGQYLQSKEQKEDAALVFSDIKNAGDLDYVACWYLKAAKYIYNTNKKVGLVSTNSICQGEQVGILWTELLGKYNIKIHFAHQTFKWNNEAKGVAAVHCVVVGFAAFDVKEKYIFEYKDIKGEPTKVSVKNISPYLVEGTNIIISTRSKPICNVSEMYKGSQPTDGGNLLFSDEEKIEFLKIEPFAEKFIKPFISAHEFLNNKKRWCLWLVDALPNELRSLPNVMKRINEVKKMRLASSKAATVKWAEKPTLFTENRQPNSDYILIPRVSSENRIYIPMGFFSKENIISDTCISVPNATFYEFGILTSKMHMAWMRYTCGRLKSDYRYSNTLVYNNYPFPTNSSAAQKDKVEMAARKVLEVRSLYAEKGSSLADMYSAAMPKDLLDAHTTLDKAVDACYGKGDYGSDAKRVAFLFGEYERLLQEVSIKLGK